MHLEAMHRRPRRVEAQQPALQPRLQVDADGAHVAHDLLLRFLEGEVQAALAARAGAVGEVSGEDGLAGARRAGDQDAAAAVVALPAEHRVEVRRCRSRSRSVEAGWSRPAEVIGRTEMPCSSIRNGYSLVPCAEPRYLTTRSRRVEICVGHAVIEQDHAVGDVLLQARGG